MTATITCAGCQFGYAESALFCPNCGRPKVRDTSGDALVGKLLGERFQVQALIGQGASGTIYRAEHVTLRRRVAIKVLHHELSRDDLAVERFRREATTVADIDNEHIVEIHDFGRTPDGRLYLAMELLEGEGLDAVIAREKQLSVERTADILIQVGEALMEAHAIGYIHRDLRPRNIYLTVRRGKANFVKLLDFGLAKLVETENAASTNLGMTFGDPHYMSPEAARGDRIDRRADIYQLGCVAYEMLTGAPPFSGERVFDILTKQVTEAPAPLPSKRAGVPLWMEAAVTKMLAKDPENRFATTSRMVDALRRGLETGEVMEDEIARRRESIPPPSVSRVMQRMGITPEPEPEPAPVPAPAPVPVAARPEPVELVGQARRGTGTPRIGVPIVKAPVDAPGAVSSSVSPPVSSSPASSAAAAVDAQAPVAGTIEPVSPPAPEPAAPIAPVETDPSNISQVWYEEGERAASASRSVGSRRAAPSVTDLGFDEYELPTRRRWGAIIGVLAVLVVGGVVAFAMTRDGGGTATPAGDTELAATPATVDAAPSTIITGVDAGPAAELAPTDTELDSMAPTKIAKATPARVASQPAKAQPAAEKRTTTTAKVASTSSTPKTGEFGLLPAEDPVFRRPGGDTAPRDTTPTTTTSSTTQAKTSDPSGVSGAEGPLDPYGASDPAPTGGNPEQKATFFANLGTQQLLSGDTGNAAANFKKAIELDPKNVAAVTGMGEIALSQGLFGDAIAHLRKAARYAPRNARVLTLLGEAYLSSGNYTEAANHFKKALQLEPDNARARDGYNDASERVPPPTDEE